MSHALKLTRNVRDNKRRVMPRLGRGGKKATAVARQVQVTLGDLIAAAFDTVGTEVKDVARLLASPQLGANAGRRIVLVP